MMLVKTKKVGNDFKEAAKISNITFWPVFECIICKGKHGFKIDGNDISYDSSCACTHWCEQNGLRLWEDIATFYNKQKNAISIKQMDEFWGFNKNKRELLNG